MARKVSCVGQFHAIAISEGAPREARAQDVIDLPQSLVASFAALQADMHASGANTAITFDANDTITLCHVAAQKLHAQNFHFVA